MDTDFSVLCIISAPMIRECVIGWKYIQTQSTIGSRDKFICYIFSYKSFDGEIKETPLIHKLQ